MMSENENIIFDLHIDPVAAQSSFKYIVDK